MDTDTEDTQFIEAMENAEREFMRRKEVDVENALFIQAVDCAEREFEQKKEIERRIGIKLKARGLTPIITKSARRTRTPAIHRPPKTRHISSLPDFKEMASCAYKEAAAIHLMKRKSFQEAESKKIALKIERDAQMAMCVRIRKSLNLK